MPFICANDDKEVQAAVFKSKLIKRNTTHALENLAAVWGALFVSCDRGTQAVEKNQIICEDSLVNPFQCSGRIARLN